MIICSKFCLLKVRVHKYFKNIIYCQNVSYSLQGGSHGPTLTAARTVSNYYKPQFPVVRVHVDSKCMIVNMWIWMFNNVLQQNKVWVYIYTSVPYSWIQVYCWILTQRTYQQWRDQNNDLPSSMCSVSWYGFHEWLKSTCNCDFRSKMFKWSDVLQ